MCNTNAIWIDTDGKTYSCDNDKPSHAFLLSRKDLSGQEWIKKVSSIFDLVKRGWIGIYFNYYGSGEHAIVTHHKYAKQLCDAKFGVIDEYGSRPCTFVEPLAENEHSDILLKPLILKYINGSVVFRRSK